ncbi:hypothetical protein WIS52_23995 [Pseudonocardia nematodicida]|uniref:FHA domain-containing protein n=1 Tax=Pseudonocardia nematodicida TaxID=1206997 RepID=A0ABV1KGG1_9PSEU
MAETARSFSPPIVVRHGAPGAEPPVLVNGRRSAGHARLDVLAGDWTVDKEAYIAGGTERIRSGRRV